MIHTNNIERNQQTRPEWYVAPEAIESEVAQFLAWQGRQPSNAGPGTIAEAWEQAGTGPRYHANVERARQAISDYKRLAQDMAAQGRPCDPPQWLQPEVAAPAPALDPLAPRADFGGAATRV